MTIFNSDGTQYKLEGPNPLMKEQNYFDGFSLHNFDWKSEIKKENTIVVPVKSDFNIKEIEKPLPVCEDVTQPEPSKIVEKIKSKELSINSNVTRIHCLPATVEKKVDDLYGETRLINGWGSPFLFEAIIVEQNDFMITFWTNIGIIEFGSIIYPVSRDKRWWKISNKKEEKEGYLYNALTSDINPDFTL